MKIIYLHQYFLTPDMAGGTRSYEMAKRLVAHGHEVHMVTTWFEGEPPVTTSNWFVRDIDGIHVHFLPVPYSNKLGFLQRLIAFFRFALRAGRYASSIGGDVVFATSTPLTIVIPAVWAKRCLRVPMVFEVRDLWPDLPIAVGAIRNPVLIKLARWMEHGAYKNAARIIALSPGMAEGVCRTGYDPRNVSVIPNSADLELFDPARASSTEFLEAHPELREHPLVIYPGTLGKINGVSWFTELAAEVAITRSDVYFVVIGDGAERTLVESRARSLRVLGKNFFMYPKLPKRAVVSAYAASAVVASLFLDVPEMRANSANKFFDALAAAKPVVINYGGWQETLLDESGAGIAIGHDVKRAASALLELLASDERLARAGAAARSLAERRFSRDVLAAQLQRVIVDAVSERGNRQREDEDGQ